MTAQSQSVEQVRGYISVQALPRTLRELQRDFRNEFGWSESDSIRHVTFAKRVLVLHDWQFAGRSFFWREEQDRFLRARLLAASAEPVSKAALLRSAASRGRTGRADLERVLKTLLAAGDIRCVGAPFSRQLLYFRKDAGMAYLRASAAGMAKLFARFREAGATPAEVQGLVSELLGGENQTVRMPVRRELADQIHQRLRQMTPADPAPVTVQQLRAAFPGADKQEFDQAVLALAQQHRVWLTTHDHGWALPPDGRDQLVFDGGRNLYVAVTLRH